jgi:hypothetical protein
VAAIAIIITTLTNMMVKTKKARRKTRIKNNIDGRATHLGGNNDY